VREVKLHRPQPSATEQLEILYPDHPYPNRKLIMPRRYAPISNTHTTINNKNLDTTAYNKIPNTITPNRTIITEIPDEPTTPQENISTLTPPNNDTVQTTLSSTQFPIDQLLPLETEF
jgi:hypothetical protein